MPTDETLTVRKHHPKPCDWCRKIYKPNNATQRYCCNECKWANVSKEIRAKKTKRCAQCTKPFYNKNYAAKYCSHPCYLEAAKARRQEYFGVLKQTQLQCPHCTKWFFKRSINHLYCSRSCYLNYEKHQRYLRRKANSRTACKHCNGPITELGRVYCSTVCRQKHKNIGRKIFSKVCAFCSKEYKTYSVGSFHCSKSCCTKASLRNKIDEKELRHEAYLKREKLRETIENRVTLSKILPSDTGHSDAIKAFLKRGGTIKQYQPLKVEQAKTAMPTNMWSFDDSDL